MKILINVVDGLVSVNGEARAIDLSAIDSEIESVVFDTANNIGVITLVNTSTYAIGKTAFSNLYGQYWQAYNAAGPAPSRSLEAIKDDKREQINSIRDNLEQGGFPYMEKIIDSNSVSVQRMTVAVLAAQAALSAGQPFNIDWTCQDNSVLALDETGMLGMPVALATFGNALHEKARLKKADIDAATDAAAVAAVSWH